jgi:hypothetical protein
LEPLATHPSFPFPKVTHTDNLDLDIDLDQILGQRVDLDKTGVDGPREPSELGYQADITLLDRLVRVRADNAAGDGAESADDGSERVHHRPVPTMVVLVSVVGLDDARIAGLQVLPPRRLDLDQRLVGAAAGASAVDGSFSSVAHGSCSDRMGRCRSDGGICCEDGTRRRRRGSSGGIGVGVVVCFHCRRAGGVCIFIGHWRMGRTGERGMLIPVAPALPGLGALAVLRAWF